MADYFEMSYRELQQELKNRGLKASGKKQELIDRLDVSDASGYIDEEAEEAECILNANTKMFHVKTLSGSWYDIRLSNDQTILDLKVELSEKTGIEIEQIRLYEQNGCILDDNTNISDFIYDEIFLDMMIRLRSKKKN